MVNKCRDWNLPGHIDEIVFGGNSTFTEVFFLPLCGAGALAFLLWCSLELNQGTKLAALLAALSDISSKHLKGHSGETGFWPGYQPTRNIRNPAPHTFLTWWENYFGRWVNYKYFLIIIFFNKKTLPRFRLFSGKAQPPTHTDTAFGRSSSPCGFDILPSTSWSC